MTPSPVRPGPVYLTVLVIATCGLVYELVAGALASYLLGDTVTQFSLVIGIYLTAMGAGAWLSKFIEKGVARRFVEIEIAVAHDLSFPRAGRTPVRAASTANERGCTT